MKMFRVRNSQGTALLAIIGFIILTAIIAEAFLLYFYNQYRITLQKILYEKTFYIALSGIEWAKVIIRSQNPSYLPLLKNEGVWINNWDVFPKLRYDHDPSQEYPDLPYSFILGIKLRDNNLISYCESEISSGTEKVFAARRIEVTLPPPADPLTPPDVSETSWAEISPPGTSADL